MSTVGRFRWSVGSRLSFFFLFIFLFKLQSYFCCWLTASYMSQTSVDAVCPQFCLYCDMGRMQNSELPETFYKKCSHKMQWGNDILSSLVFLSVSIPFLLLICPHLILLPPSVFIVLQLQPLKLDNTMGDRGGGPHCAPFGEAWWWEVGQEEEWLDLRGLLLAHD